MTLHNREAERRRLAWRCRRGMLELDIVLQRFVAEHFQSMTAQELAVFDGLLDMADNDFWGLIQKDSEQNNLVLTSLLAKLHASSQAQANDG